MKLAEAYVEVETNQAKFGKELKTMESSVKKSTDRMKKNFDRIGQGVSQISSVARIGFLGITAAIAGSVYAFTTMGDQIHKMSIRTGVAATELSALGYAAQISGAELNTVEKSLRYLAARMMDAETGLAEAKRAFDELGIAVTDTEGHLRPTVDVLKDAADKIAVMTNETEKGALAGEIFGMRFGPMLLPLLNEGSAGIEKLMDKAKELGITIDTEAAAAAAEFNDRLTDMKGVLAALGREVGEVFLPVFRNTTVIIIDKVKEWRKAIDALTPQQKKLIAQVVLLGTAALGAIGALGLFAKLAVVVKAAGLIIAGTFGLITSPIGLIILAIGALALAWAYNWGDIQGKTEAVWKILEPIFKAIWDWLGKAWEWSLKNVPKAWDWLKDTVWPFIKDIFQKIRDGLSTAWEWALDAVKTAWDWLGKTWVYIRETFGKIRGGLRVGWVWFLGTLETAWDWLTETLWPFIQENFTKIKDALKVGWEWGLAAVRIAWDWLSNELWPHIQKVFGYIKEALATGWEWALGKVKIAWDWLKDTVWPKLQEIFQGIWDWLHKAWDWSLDKVKDAWKWFEETLIPFLEKYTKITLEWILNLGGNIWEQIEKLIEWLKQIPKTIKETMVDWGIWGAKADAATRGVIDNIDEVAKIVEEKIGKEIPQELRLMSVALIASESSFDRNAKAVDKLGNEYKGLGQHGEAAIKDLKEMGLAIDDINDPAQGAAATMAYFSKILEENNGDIAKSILIYKGWGKELVKAGGDIDKLPEEAKKQLAIYIKILKEFAEDSYKIVTKGTHIAVYGKSPGGIVGELEAGQKDVKKQLDKMLDSMDEMTKKMMKVFEPIIGLFKKMFEGITDTMIASENETISQMGKDLKAFVDMVFAMMMGLFDAAKMEGDKTATSLTAAGHRMMAAMYGVAEKGKSLWQKFCEAVKDMFVGLSDSLQSALLDFSKTVLTTTTSMGKAFFNLAQTIYTSLVEFALRQLTEMLSKKLVKAYKLTSEAMIAFADVASSSIIAIIVLVAELLGILKITANSIEILGIRIRTATEHFETAWGTIGRSMYFTNVEVGKLAEHLQEAGELMYPLIGTAIELGDAAAYIEREFAKVGLQISESLGAAKDKLEDLYQAQVDLGASTREKLIAELDRYYDYRVLKEKSLDELLALSAETRLGIEQGTITEVEESEEEQEARRKDRAISRLQQIEDQYTKEDELLRRKIALTEIEIKFLELKMEREAHGHSQRAKQLEKELGLMLESYHESVEAFKEAEEGKREAAGDTTKAIKGETKEQAKAVKGAAEDEAEDVERAAEDMEKSWNDLTADIIQEMEKTFGRSGAVPIALNQAVQAMIEKIGTLPTRIDFDVIGNLFMPTIPSIGTQYFDIYGRYHAPSIPGAQIGIPYVPRTMPVVVHKEEAILNPPQAKEWRKGEEGGRGGISIGTISLMLPNIRTAEDLERMSPAAWKRVLDKGLIRGMKMSAVDGKLSKESVMMKR